MDIGFLPADGFDTASSRIRVYSLLKPLAALGVRPRIGAEGPLDALFVQKRVDAQVLDRARQARQRGTLLLYDCDDLGTALSNFAPSDLLAEMLSLTDVVTTNSEAVGEALSRDHCRQLCVELLPDTVDYWLKQPLRVPAGPDETLRLLWFGNTDNLPMVERYLTAVAALPDARLVVCTRARGRAALPGLDPAGFEFAAWTLDGFPGVLQSCHLSLLMHDGRPVDRAKSNNRMIASIAWGVPALVSRTPEYERTAIRAGVPEAVFDGPHDLARVVEAHRSASARRHYLDRAQPRIWEQHAPPVVARRLVEIIASRRCRQMQRDGRHPVLAP